ncbi:hypothetical protein LTR02_016816 [Friedmanniomyces endolithicus]|nr:hypothetical protein LTR94_021683 [Friedmanniomyces endolithicus]KAK0769291.1 hypothetical protein LTR59_017121 [Friedmanniomyces endolithicus]KAK0771811.1 hypothetical protein LTR38_017099 [Friedmanniomyces endolithicus]KAK0807013.1 hypothetical protein LTR75_006822 [Friedmanniomyces endolithicus]KAK0841836.1 hypothetical protein LTS02_016698 [Friedmanniomyces endolithicus]
MSYTPDPHHNRIYSPQPHPPAPPPKHSGSSTPARGPPLPPPPPGAQHHNGPSELDGNQTALNSQYRPAQMPPIPAIEQKWLPHTLQDRTTADLHAILNDQTLQMALLDSPDTTHPAIPASQQALYPLIDTNIHLASSLQDLEAHLTTLRNQTQSRLLSLKALEQQHRSKVAETENALVDFSPMALYQRLSTGVREQDELLWGVEESWLEEEGIASEREVVEFVRRVKEGKRVAFLRRERKGRWDEGRVGGWR